MEEKVEIKNPAEMRGFGGAILQRDVFHAGPKTKQVSWSDLKIEPEEPGSEFVGKIITILSIQTKIFSVIMMHLFSPLLQTWRFAT